MFVVNSDSNRNDLQIISVATLLFDRYTSFLRYRTNDENDEDDNSGDDCDEDELINDEWYEAFREKSEEKIYDDLCAVVSSKVETTSDWHATDAN